MRSSDGTFYNDLLLIFPSNKGGRDFSETKSYFIGLVSVKRECVKRNIFETVAFFHEE